jgi:hypothetical protein
VCSSKLGQSEVQDFDRPAFRQHDVSRLEVAVHHALFVGGVERRDDLPPDRQRVADLQSTRDPVRQRLAFDELEDQGAHALRLLDAVNRGNVGVVQRRQRPCFAFEAGQSIRIACERTRQDLDGDVPAETGIPGAVNFAHSAFAKLAEDAVRADVFRDHGDSVDYRRHPSEA